MKYLIKTALLGLIMVVASCSASGETGKTIDMESQRAATAVINCKIAETSDLRLDSLIFVREKMPAVFAKELSRSQSQIMKKFFSFVMFSGLSGRFDDESGKGDPDKKAERNAEVWREFLTMNEPYRKEVAQYEKSDRPYYLFGLATITNLKDSSKNERRLYIFPVDTPDSLLDVKGIRTSKRSDFAIAILMTHIDPQDIDKDFIKKGDQAVFESKPVQSNPIYKFLLQ